MFKVLLSQMPLQLTLNLVHYLSNKQHVFVVVNQIHITMRVVTMVISSYYRGLRLSFLFTISSTIKIIKKRIGYPVQSQPLKKKN